MRKTATNDFILFPLHGYIQDLAEKVYILSHDTRSELKKGGLDPSEVMIQFHYGIAMATYQFYLDTERNFGLGLIKKHLSRCIEIHRSRPLSYQDKRKTLMVDGGVVIKEYIQSLKKLTRQDNNNLNRYISQFENHCKFIGAEPLLINVIEKEYKLEDSKCKSSASMLDVVKSKSITDHIYLLLKLGKLKSARQLRTKYCKRIPDPMVNLIILFSKLQSVFNHEILLIYNHQEPKNSCRDLAEAYDFLGIYPLSKIYSTVSEQREDKILEKKSSECIVDTNHLFPTRAVTLLNDVLSEREWITNVLSHLPVIPGFKTHFLPIYKLEWQCSHEEKHFNQLFKQPNTDSASHSQETNNLLRKCLLIYCSFAGERLSAKGWYLWTVAPSGQVVTGYLTDKEEFKSLLELLIKLKKIPAHAQLQSLEENIQDALEKLWKSLHIQLNSNQVSVFQALSAKEYYDQRLLKKGILIYNAEQYESACSLRERFKSTVNQGFSAILQISESYYVAILVQPKRNREEKKHPLRMIYMMDSHSHSTTITRADIDRRLNWFTGLINRIEYCLVMLTTPPQKIHGNDSLLHAYLNAALALWLFDNGHWHNLKEYFSLQRLTHKENVEAIKYWWANPSLDNKHALESFLNAASGKRSIEVLLEELKNYATVYFIAGFSGLVASAILEKGEALIKTLAAIKKIADLKQSLIKDLFSPDILSPVQKAVQKDLVQCLDNLIDQQENFGQVIDLYLVKDFLLAALKKAVAEVLKFQYNVAKVFENFEDILEHYSLLILVEKTDCSCPFLLNILTYISSHSQGKDYFKLLIILEEMYKACQPHKMLEELKESAVKVKDLFSGVSDRQQQIISVSATESLKTLNQVLVPLVNAKKSIARIMEYYDYLLHACYDETERTHLQAHVVKTIHPCITHLQFEFSDLSECIKDLFDYADEQKLQKEVVHVVHPELKSLKSGSAVTDYFQPLLDLRKENQEQVYRKRAVYYFSGYIRTKMMNNLECYINSLISFRHQSLSAMEKFERHLHDYFLELIKNSIQLAKISTVAKNCHLDLSMSKPVGYKNKIELYNKGLRFLEKQDLKSIKAAIIKVFECLRDDKHSHAPYLTQKLTDFCRLVHRFAQIESELPRFRTVFWKALHQCYDRVATVELFSPEGRVVREIFRRLKQQANFDDINLIFKTIDLKTNGLGEILNKCQLFCEHGDIKGVAEISAFLREAIVSITERYTSSLLSFRHQALAAFLEFECGYYDYLSSYSMVSQRDQKKIECRIDDLAHLHSGDDYAKKLVFLQKFKNSLPNDLQAILDRALQQDYQIDIDKKLDVHTHQIYLNDKLHNLKKLIDGYNNWRQIEITEEMNYTIYEITVTSATVKQIMSWLRENNKRCFNPNNEIRIIASGTLYLDMDINDPGFSGVDIALIALNQKLAPGKPNFEIKTNGADGGAHAQPCATSGHHCNPEGKGLPGADGLDGFPGKGAGHVYMVADELPRMSIFAEGGRGGPGQTGGDGAAGKDGVDGVDGKLTSSGILGRKKGGRRYDYGGINYLQISVGTDGGLGGLGGDAGASGYGGEGGEAGFIDVFSLRGHTADVKKVAGDGQAGIDGKRDLAKPGEAGKHGRDGRDGAWLSNGRVLPGFTQVEERLGRLIFSERYSRIKQVEWWWASDLTFPEFAQDDNHSTFSNKYPMSDAKEKKGLPSQLQHTQALSVRQIHAINSASLIRQVSAYFLICSDSKAPNQYAHWLAPRLNQFLIRWAHVAGLDEPPIATLPDAEYEIKQIHQLRMQFLTIAESEQQQLTATKISSDSLSIGIDILSTALLQQHQAFLQQHVELKQQLQREIDQINADQLNSGLPIRSDTIAACHEKIDRMIAAEQMNLRASRFSQRQHREISDYCQQQKVSASVQTVGLRLQEFKTQAVMTTRQFKLIEEKSPLIPKLNEFLIKFNQDREPNSLLDIFDKLLKNIQALENQQIFKIFSITLPVFLFNLQHSGIALNKPELWLDRQAELDSKIIELKKIIHSPGAIYNLIQKLASGLHTELTRSQWLQWLLFSRQYGHTIADGQLQQLELMVRTADKIAIASLNSQHPLCVNLLNPLPVLSVELPQKFKQWEEVIRKIAIFNQTPSIDVWVKIWENCCNFLLPALKSEEEYQLLLQNNSVLAWIILLMTDLRTHLKADKFKPGFDVSKPITPIYDCLKRLPVSALHECFLPSSSLKSSDIEDKASLSTLLYAFENSHDPVHILPILQKIAKMQQVNQSVEQLLDLFAEFIIQESESIIKQFSDLNKIKEYLLKIVKKSFLKQKYFFYFIYVTVDYHQNYSELTHRLEQRDKSNDFHNAWKGFQQRSLNNDNLNTPEHFFSYAASLIALLKSLPNSPEKCRTIIQDAIDIVNFEMNLVNNFPEKNSLQAKHSYICEEKNHWRLIWCEEKCIVSGAIVLSFSEQKELISKLRSLLPAESEINLTANHPHLFRKLQSIIIREYYLTPASIWQSIMKNEKYNEKNLLINFKKSIPENLNSELEEKTDYNINLNWAAKICKYINDFSQHVLLILHWQSILTFRFNCFGSALEHICNTVQTEVKGSDSLFLSENFYNLDVFFNNFYDAMTFCVGTPDFSQEDFLSIGFGCVFKEIGQVRQGKQGQVLARVYSQLIKKFTMTEKESFLKAIQWKDPKQLSMQNIKADNSQNIYYFLKTINFHKDMHQILLTILTANRKDGLLPKIEDRMQIICDFLNLQHDSNYGLFNKLRFDLLQKLVELNPEHNQEEKQFSASWTLLCHVEDGLTAPSAEEIKLSVGGFQQLSKIAENSKDPILSESLEKLVKFFNIYLLQLMVKNCIGETVKICRCKEKLPSLITIRPGKIYFTTGGEYCFEEAGPIRMAHAGYGLETRDLYSISPNEEITEIKLKLWEKYALLDQVKYWKTGISPWLKIMIEHPQYVVDPSSKGFAFDFKNITYEQIEEQIFLLIKNTQDSALENLVKVIEKINIRFSKDQLKTISGYAGEIKQPKDNAWLTPQMMIEFNWLMTDLSVLIEAEGLSEDFLKVIQIIAYFDQLTDVIVIIKTYPPFEWQRKLLLSHLERRFSHFIIDIEQIELLRDQLESLDSKLLICFHQKFSNYLSKKITLGISAVTQQILADSIIKTIRLMIKIKVVDSAFLSRLDHADLSFWESILSEEIFIQIFNDQLLTIRRQSGSMPKHLCEKFLFFVNRLRLMWKNDSKFYEFLNPLFDQLRQNKDHLKKILESTIKPLYYGNMQLEDVKDIPSSRAKRIERQDIDSVMRKIATTHADYPYAFIIDDLFITELKKVALAASMMRQSDGIEAKIREEINIIKSNKQYQENSEQYVRAHRLEIAPLILCAWSVVNHGQFPHATQIVNFWAFINSNDHGLLAQVRTGEGKTLIVGLLAAFLALCGHAVDVLSSNADLAIEGVDKCRAFFQLLLLSCGHICHRNKRTNQQAYKMDIVYGEIGGFQGDFLQQEFEGKQIYGNRYSKTTHPHREKYLIVDEVDSMGLDKARHVLYLSHTIESLKWLDGVFLNIWAAALGMKVDNPNDVDREIAQMSTIIIRMVEEGSIFIPPELINFVRQKVPRWIASALKARFMENKDNFVIDINKNDENILNRQKDIVVIDKDTGVEQYSTRWSEGLAQMLWLKYRRKLFAESLKALFISNKKFFQGYGKRLYGLTGTLGSEDSKGFLSEIYTVKLIEIPPSIPRSYQQYTGKVAIKEMDWLYCVADTCLKMINTRPVLIICENVELSDHVWEELKQRNVPLHKIKKYACADDKIEEHFRHHPAIAGDIIIATNKGGRGTDICISEQTFTNGGLNGGLHVILTYLPGNIRVEEQAFGRTARNGQPGTGEFILCIKDKDLLVEVDMNTISTETGILPDEISELIIEKARIKRDALETERLSQLKQKDTLHLDTEEILFSEFVNFKKEKLKELEKTWPLSKTESKREVEDKKSTHDKESKYNSDNEQEEKHPCITAMDKILKDRWSFWLDAQKDEISKINNGRDQVNIITKFKKDFYNGIQSSFSKLISAQNPAEILATDFVATPAEAILLADVYLQKKLFYPALGLFESAIKKEDISGRAYIGKLFCYMKLQKTPKKSLKQVKEIRRMLKQALSQLKVLQINLIANLKIHEMLAKHMTSNVLKIISSRDDFYSAQVQSKIEVLSIHIHNLQKALGTYIEPIDLIPPAEGNQENKLSSSQINYAKNIFDLLKEHKIIYGYRLKKKFFPFSKAEEMQKKINDKLDPALAQHVINILKEKKEVTDELFPEDFKSVVCCQEELWDAIVPLGSESVYVLDTSTLDREIEQRFEGIWADLKSKIKVRQVDMSLFEATNLTRDFKIYLENKKFLYQLRRYPLQKIQTQNLEFKNEYKKYSQLEFREAKSEQIGIIVFLNKLLAKLTELKHDFLYEDDLPFLNREKEIERILFFLRDINILKRGGICLQDKLGDIDEIISKKLDGCLQDSKFTSQKDFIKSRLLGITGDVRTNYNHLEASLVDFYGLETQSRPPEELEFFNGLGLDQFLIFKKHWFDWRAFVVAMIGLAQVVVGILLICFGVPNFGLALIAEGISDMLYATTAGLSGAFSWQEWAVQKVVSVSISLITSGLSKLKSLGEQAVKIGSLSKSALFTKHILKAAVEFTSQLAMHYLTEASINILQTTVVDGIVQCIEKAILDNINEKFENQLIFMRKNSKDDNDFDKSANEMLEKLRKCLAPEKRLLVDSLEKIRFSVMNIINKEFDKILSGIDNSGHKHAKNAIRLLKSAYIAHKLLQVAQFALSGYELYAALQPILNAPDVKEQDKCSVDKSMINMHLSTLRDLMKNFVRQGLTKQLHSAVQQAIGRVLKSVVESINKEIDGRIDNHFGNKNPFAVIEQLNSQQSDRSILEDYNNDDHKQEINKIADSEQINNPREAIKDLQEMMKDPNRPLGRIDLKMLSDMNRRTYYVKDEHGNLQVIRPHGARRLIGFFKDPVSLNYHRGRGEEVGHYTAALAKGSVDSQMLGKNNCLLTASAQAQGKNSSLIDDRLERQKLMQYAQTHSQTFMKSFNNMTKKGRNPLIGGARAPAGSIPRTAFILENGQFVYNSKGRPNNQNQPAVVKQSIERLLSQSEPLSENQNKFIRDHQQGQGSLARHDLDMAHEVSADSTGKLLARLGNMQDGGKNRKLFNRLAIERVPHRTSEMMHCFDQFTNHNNTPAMRQQALMRTFSILNAAPGNLRPANRGPNRALQSHLDLNLSLGKEGYYVPMHSVRNRAPESVLRAAVGLPHDDSRKRQVGGSSQVEVQSSNVDPVSHQSYARYRRHSLSILIESSRSERTHDYDPLVVPTEQRRPHS